MQERQLVKPLERIAGETRCSINDAMSMFMRPSVVLAYRERLDPSRLRHALARVLVDFDVFSGRLVRRRGDWFIEHGFGALFETAESADGCQALGAAVRSGPSALVCPRLSFVATALGRGPLLAARLTQTPDGSVLGVTSNHVLGDYHSMMLLLRAWALAYGDKPHKKPVSVADREAFLRARIPVESSGAIEARVLSWSEFLRSNVSRFWAARDLQRVALDFSWSEIAAIHAAASGDRAVTPGDALCAYIAWTLRTHGQDISPYFSVTINLRKNFGLPLNLLGNTSDHVTTLARPGDSPAAIASSLRANIETYGASSMIQNQWLALRASHPGLSSSLRFWSFGEPHHTIVRLSNVSRAGHSQLIFGSARPTFVHTRASDAPIVGLGTIFASPSVKGLTMDVVLPSKLIEQLARSRAQATLSPSKAMKTEAGMHV